jgi:hypothetical protein
MTGLCHRCGYFHSGAPEPEPNPIPSEADLLEATWKGNVERMFLTAQTERTELKEKLDILLDILTATNDADRLGRVAKARNKLKKNPLLASIRKANETA